VRQVEARQAVDELAVGDQHLRLGEIQRVLEVAASRREVERRIGGACRVRAEPRPEHVRAGRLPRGDVVAQLDAEALEAVARAPRLADGVRACPLLVLEEDEELVRVGGGARRQQIGYHALLARRELQVLRHHPSQIAY
jgi:hypothetical protein